MGNVTRQNHNIGRIDCNTVCRKLRYFTLDIDGRFLLLFKTSFYVSTFLTALKLSTFVHTDIHNIAMGQNLPFVSENSSYH